jgi:hypothetical protein
VVAIAGGYQIDVQNDGCGNFAANPKEKTMSFADLCLFLGVLIAFTTLILKAVEISRTK